MRVHARNFLRHTDDTRTKVPVLADDLNKLLVGLLAGTIGVNENRQRLSNADGVRELDEGTASKTASDERLGDPASGVRSRTVDLGEVLSGESTSTVGTPTTVGVDNDLTACETGVTLRTTDNEATGGLDLDIGVNQTEIFFRHIKLSLRGR